VRFGIWQNRQPNFLTGDLYVGLDGRRAECVFFFLWVWFWLMDESAEGSFPRVCFVAVQVGELGAAVFVAWFSLWVFQVRSVVLGRPDPIRHVLVWLCRGPAWALSDVGVFKVLVVCSP